MLPTLRAATPRDLDFVFGLAQNGARHGHFDSRIMTDRRMARSYFDAILGKGSDPWGGPARAYVVESAGERIGAMLVTRASGTPDEAVELAMIALRKAYRGRGLGAVVLDMFLAQHLPYQSVYARCLPASQTLHRMLLARGFVEAGSLGKSVILRHGVTGRLVSSDTAGVEPSPAC